MCRLGEFILRARDDEVRLDVACPLRGQPSVMMGRKEGRGTKRTDRKPTFLAVPNLSRSRRVPCGIYSLPSESPTFRPRLTGPRQLKGNAASGQCHHPSTHSHATVNLEQRASYCPTDAMMLCYTRTQRQKSLHMPPRRRQSWKGTRGWAKMTGADDHDGIQHPLSAFRQRNKGLRPSGLSHPFRAMADQITNRRVGSKQHKELTAQTSSRGVAQTFLFFAGAT